MTLKQVITIPIVTLIVCLLIISCEKDNNDLPVGEDWVNLETKVYFIDTLLVETSTFKFDSIIVSNANRLLVGAYNDPVFGVTKSKSYVQLSNSTYTIDDDAVFDSIALILKYDNYFYNDTIPVQKVNVYEVTEDIEYDDDTDSFYNTTNFTFNSLPIASKSFLAEPTKKDSVHITINNDFGKNLFDNLQQDRINNSDEFLKEYKGLLIESDSNNTAILGFLNTSFIRIYYTNKNELEIEEKTINLPFNSVYSFNNISNEMKGTILESLENQEEQLLSTVTDNNSFMQAGTGIATRINIPNIESIYNINGSGIIVDANLKISIKKNSNTKNLYTNDSLNVYIVNRKAEILANLTDIQGNTVIGLIENKDSEFNTENYSIPVKYFLNLKLTDINADNMFLAIYPKDFTQSVNRYILNGEEEKESIKTKLELTYAIYD